MPRVDTARVEALLAQYRQLTPAEQEWFVLQLQDEPVFLQIVNDLVHEELSGEIDAELYKEGVHEVLSALGSSFMRTPQHEACDRYIAAQKQAGRTWNTIIEDVYHRFPEDGGRSKNGNRLSLAAIRQRYYRARARWEP
jgi:hypothetical protein